MPLVLNFEFGAVVVVVAVLLALSAFSLELLPGVREVLSSIADILSTDEGSISFICIFSE